MTLKCGCATRTARMFGCEYRIDEQVESMHDERGTPETPTLAGAVRAEDRQVLARVAAAPIIPLNNNLVSRPWGGQRLCAHKVCLLKTPSAVETVAFRTGTGYRPRHVRDRLSSPPFSTPRQLPSARGAPA